MKYAVIVEEGESSFGAHVLICRASNRARWATADELACLSGIAPVMERSGKSAWIRWRYFCPKFMRQSFHEYAGESVQHSFWAGAYYQQQLSKGKSHQAAARTLAYKWIRIIWKCWQTNTPYSEVKYLEELAKEGLATAGLCSDEPFLVSKNFLTRQPQMAC